MKQIREKDAEFLDEYMNEAAEKTRDGERGTRIDKMLEIVRKHWYKPKKRSWPAPCR